MSVMLSPNAIDWTGALFGRLTVLEPLAQRAVGSGAVIWRCQCSCGRQTVVAANNLTRGHTRSCGCIHTETITTHGAARDTGATREYRVWNTMKNRCRNPRDKNFRHYG